MLQFRREDVEKLVQLLNEIEEHGWTYKSTDSHKIEIYDEHDELIGIYEL